MCGITGKFIRAKGEVNPDEIKLMSDTLVHRGPDGYGHWISSNKKIGFGHRRLAIVDLSNNANQPMCNEDGSVWITFNGEIYNHQKLRSELITHNHFFKTDHSDTEVLIHGYEEWGIDGLLERINGDFAFSIYDQNKRDIYLVRDHVGVKPLYFYLDNSKLIFASEIKAILADRDVKREIDFNAMYHYLSFLTTPAPLTMFKGIYKLHPGSYIKIDESNKFSWKKYWNPILENSHLEKELKSLSNTAKEDFYINGIQNRLRESVKGRMMSDVPYGVFLSGGIDSSLNVALMSELSTKPIETFTIGFKDYKNLNELNYADQVSNKFKTNHHEILIDKEDMIGYLEKMVHHQDEPLADWVCIPLYFVSKLTKDSGVTVVQVGEGSDEQFCGYKSYMGYLDLYHNYWRPFQHLPKLLQSGINYVAKSIISQNSLKSLVYLDIINRASLDKEHFWSGAMVYWENMKENILYKLSKTKTKSNLNLELIESGFLPESFLKYDSFEIIKSYKKSFLETSMSDDILAKMIYFEFNLRLPELLLMRVDKITMSESLEARVPFLDKELVEFTMKIPEKYKVKNGVQKYLLKKAVEGIIPDNIIYRKKAGFGAPMSEWLRTSFGVDVKNEILSSKLIQEAGFNETYIEAMIDNHTAGRSENSLYIWNLYNLVAWYKYWIC